MRIEINRVGRRTYKLSLYPYADDSRAWIGFEAGTAWTLAGARRKARRILAGQELLGTAPVIIQSAASP